MAKIPRSEWPKIVERLKTKGPSQVAQAYGVTPPAIIYVKNNYKKPRKASQKAEPKVPAKAAKSNGATPVGRVVSIEDGPESTATSPLTVTLTPSLDWDITDAQADDDVEVEVVQTDRAKADAAVVAAYRQVLTAVVALNTGGDQRKTIDKLIQTLAELRLALA